MWRPLQSSCCCWWIFSLVLPAFVLRAECHPALTGSQAELNYPVRGFRRAMASGTRLRRATAEETYWAYSAALFLVPPRRSSAPKVSLGRPFFFTSASEEKKATHAVPLSL
ncbi:hypothetical protein Q5P01_024007 [Channa striata]|uniref:Secreted protein n=1 Tax=Channa striata TaxID=64152 RepID=A0AA88JAY3_CHASR|nr:hypothetical protein Q5P01_024007 [Channa striata]